MKMTAEEQREFRWQLSLTDEQMKFCATQPHVEDGPGAVNNRYGRAIQFGLAYPLFRRWWRQT
jgi:hypothetical protein